jgi:predicted ABC-class ATPase
MSLFIYFFNRVGLELYSNISAFISDLPTPPGVTTPLDTEHFSTRDSSGSTSQAANVSEAIELGARALLVDEDIRYVFYL